MLKKCIGIMLALALVLAACGAPAGAPAAPATGGGGAAAPAAPAGGGSEIIMTFGTADATGTFFPVGVALGSIINEHVDGIRVNVETSRGSMENAVNLQDRIIEFGIINEEITYRAIHGQDYFEGHPLPDLRAIGALMLNVSSWIAMRDSGMTMANELGGRSVSIGPEGSGNQSTAYLAFEVLGITPSSIAYMGMGEGAEEVSDGMLDASHGFAGLPTGAQLSIAQVHDTVFLGYTEDEIAAILQANPAYFRSIIPAGTYPGQDEDILTFGVKTLLVVNTDLDEEIAYRITEAIVNNLDTLVASHASLAPMSDIEHIAHLNVPLHPGAERFFRGIGVID